MVALPTPEAAGAPSAAATRGGFAVELVEEGADRGLLDNEEVRSYLEYLVVQRIARRMDRIGQAMEIRALRDPVLAEALRLLDEVETQAELFTAADGPNANQSN